MIPIHITPTGIDPLNKYQYLHYKDRHMFQPGYYRILDLAPRGYNNMIQINDKVIDEIRKLDPTYVLIPMSGEQKLDSYSRSIRGMVVPVFCIEEFEAAVRNPKVDTVMLHRYMVYNDRKTIICNLMRNLYDYGKSVWLDETVGGFTELHLASKEPMITHIITDRVYSASRDGMLMRDVKLNEFSVFGSGDVFNRDYQPILTYNQIYLECLCDGIKPPMFTEFLKGL